MIKLKIKLKINWYHANYSMLVFKFRKVYNKKVNQKNVSIENIIKVWKAIWEPNFSDCSTKNRKVDIRNQDLIKKTRA